MVKRIIPGNMSPWECEINDVKYVYPPGTEQMVPDEVAHVIDAWYASQEPKYPEPVQPEGGGGSGGGAQPDWNAAEGEPGHIMNRTHYMEKATGIMFPRGYIARIGEGTYVVPSYPVELITGEKYKVTYGTDDFECEALFMPDEETGVGGSWVLGNIGAITGDGDSGQPFIVLISSTVADEPYSVFMSVQVMDLTGNNNLDLFQIEGLHYRRKRIGTEWNKYPYNYCVPISETTLGSVGYSQIKSFMLCGGELTIMFHGSKAEDGVLLRCTEHDSEKVVFENMQIKNRTLAVSRLTVYADGTPTEYTTESYGLTAK